MNTHLEATAGPECSDADINALQNAHVSSLLHELHWLPLGFEVQLKELDVTCKDLYGIGSGCLEDQLSPIISAHPLRTVGSLQVPSITQYHLSESIFSLLQYWNNISPEIHIVSILMLVVKNMAFIVYNRIIWIWEGRKQGSEEGREGGRISSTPSWRRLCFKRTYRA